jgi:arsenate reductase
MKRIMFVCVGNSCRSQMAEGFAKHYIDKIGKTRDIEVSSVGTMPADRVSSSAIEVMKERGIDISQNKPKKVDIKKLKEADAVISMGCGAQNICPAIFADKFIDWHIEDPQGQLIERYREVRDEIEKRVKKLIEKL